MNLKDRPNEYGSILAGAIAFFISDVFDFTGEATRQLTIIIAFTPAAITGIVQFVRKLKKGGTK